MGTGVGAVGTLPLGTPLRAILGETLRQNLKPWGWAGTVATASSAGHPFPGWGDGPPRLPDPEPVPGTPILTHSDGLGVSQLLGGALSSSLLWFLFLQPRISGDPFDWSLETCH